jgi:hypothetical protein
MLLTSPRGVVRQAVARQADPGADVRRPVGCRETPALERGKTIAYHSSAVDKVRE